MASSQTHGLDLVVIDPQNSFCHPERGELFVPGADRDMERLAAFLDTWAAAIDAIHVTLDTHHELDIGHPLFWLNAEGEHPAPFTIISKQDVVDGAWRPFNPEQPCPPYGTLLDRAVEYVRQLADHDRYQLTIWPPHCRIGTFGHNLAAPIERALRAWERSRYDMVDYVTKGTNMFTEHYSGVQADVPDPDDPSTHLNTGLIQTLEQADCIVFSGEASSHCIANTIRDIADHFGEDTLRKCVLLEDAMSPVTGFEHLADDFFRDMRAKGMQMTTTTDFSM